MRDLAGYRTYVRDYFELEEADMPATLIDSWVAEGYMQIVRKIQRWPHFQVEEPLSTAAGIRSYDLPGQMENIRAIEAPWGLLDYMDYSDARDHFHQFSGVETQGRARAFSVWANRIHVWPLPDAAEAMTVVGWRRPTDWIAVGSGGVPDMPESCEPALLSWVMYKARIHQDDIENAGLDFKDFENHLDTAIAFETGTPSAFPMVMGGGGVRRRHLPMRLAYPWE